MRMSTSLRYTALFGFLIVCGAAAGQEQFSRERFLDAVAVPLKKLSATAKPARDSYGRSASAASVYLDAHMLDSPDWSGIVEIPELTMLTEGKKADYLLALAYLASKELNIPIQTKDYPNFVLVKADGLFAANVFKNATWGKRVAIDFPEFRPAAIQLLTKAAVGECTFTAGWQTNDAKEVQFMNRTCADLTRLEQTRNTEPAVQVAVPVMDAQAREWEIKQRSQLSLQELERGGVELQSKERALVANLDRTVPSRGKMRSAQSPGSEEQRSQWESELAAVRQDEEIQAAAYEIVRQRTAKAQESIRLRNEADAAARQRAQQAARDAQRDAFEHSSTGKQLFEVIRDATLASSPAPKDLLPSQQSALRAAAEGRAKCIVRYITPQDPTHQTADEQAAIGMILSDLRRGYRISNRAVQMTFALMEQQCIQDGK